MHPVPGPGQVLYRRETGGQPVGTAGRQSGAPGKDPAHLCASVHETWLPANPSAHAAIRRTDGIVVRSGTGDPTAMPRDPDCYYDSFSDDVGPVANGQLGIAIRCINKVLEEKSGKHIYKALYELADTLGWSHIATHYRNEFLARFCISDRPF